MFSNIQTFRCVSSIAKKVKYFKTENEIEETVNNNFHSYKMSYQIKKYRYNTYFYAKNKIKSSS